MGDYTAGFTGPVVKVDRTAYLTVTPITVIFCFSFNVPMSGIMTQGPGSSSV